MRLKFGFALLGFLALTGPAPAGEAKKAAVHKVTQSKSYLMVDPIYATIVANDRPIGLLMVGVGLDVSDEALRADADRAMPVLRDGYVRSLMSFAATAVRASEQPDVALIAERLQRVTDKIMHRKGARVLLAQVAMRLTH